MEPRARLQYQIIDALTDAETALNALEPLTASSSTAPEDARQVASEADVQYAKATALVGHLQEEGTKFEWFDPLNADVRVSEAVAALGVEPGAGAVLADKINNMRDGINQIRWTFSPRNRGSFDVRYRVARNGRSAAKLLDPWALCGDYSQDSGIFAAEPGRSQGRPSR